MARVKEIPLGRPHQIAVCRYVRKQLASRKGGIVLADGVGLGKTYEALATVASLLSQRQHFKERKQRRPFRVLVLVPPGLVSKWADELLLPDRFPKYLQSWRSTAHEAVVKTFTGDVVVLRRKSDLEKQSGERRYGSIELPGGLYIVNSNLLYREGKRVTQIHKTRWDAIILDEAHHIASDLVALEPHTLLANEKTATLLLTATPFQLSPQEMKGLFEATFGGYGAARHWREAVNEAKKLYQHLDFRRYRQALNRYFKSSDLDAGREAAKLREQVSHLLRLRIVRNRRSENRRYHVVDASGKATPIPVNPFKLNDNQLDEALHCPGLIDLDTEAASAYVKVRSQICDAVSRRRPTFVAGALRQLLSTWEQFRSSTSASLVNLSLPSSPHPKVKATLELVSTLLEHELREARERGWAGKILIFTTYVGAERRKDMPTDERAHGTAVTLKQTLLKHLQERYPRSRAAVRRQIFAALAATVDRFGRGLESDERSRLRRTLRVFAGSPAAAAILGRERNLRRERRKLQELLKGIEQPERLEVGLDENSEEMKRRLLGRREQRVGQILDRYSTRELVARYDGATPPKERDRHLRGFNSPFAPLVLIASSVGQEGIDLQRYCRHVVHYDLEWNPARLEQREGRVDRQGREATGPVNVYFLICRGTYDERIMHVMVNRFRWHQVLLAKKTALQAALGECPESYAAPEIVNRVALDLRPRFGR
jgi:superfamily II DNA or RNA helicase